MLKALRTNTKWIMIVVSVCFVGMMIFAWGMDITGIRSGVGAGIVGKINGDDIPYTYYDNVVKMQRQQYGDTERLSVYQERSLYEEAWNSIITQKVVEQDIKRRNIKYTDQELVTFMKFNPPQFVYSQQFAPLFFENNQFSMAKYQAFISPDNLKNPQTAPILQYIESEAASRLPATKFQESLIQSVVVTDAMVRERWLRENEFRKASFFFINAAGVADPSVTVSDDEINAYYEAHKDDFKRDSRRTLASVFVPLVPSAHDSSMVLELAKDIVTRARGGANFADLANEYTDDPGNSDRSGIKKGGDLGFFGKGRMVKEFEDTAFALAPGQISDPVLSRFGYHIIMVDSLKYVDEKAKEKVVDQVKARHILLKIEPSSDTREMVENRVNAFRDAVDKGTMFTVQAQTEGLEIRITQPFEEKALTVPGIPGSTALLVHRAFSNKKGKFLQPYFAENGYFLMTVDSILPAGTAPLTEVRQEVERTALTEKRAAFAAEVAKRIASRIQSGSTIADAVNADEYKAIQLREDTEVYRSYYIAGLGSLNKMMAAVFALNNPGECTGAVVLEEGAGVAVLNEKVPVNETQYEEDMPRLRQRIESELQNEVVQNYVDSLVKSAKIVDNRHMFVGY